MDWQDISFDGANRTLRIGVICNETCEIDVTYYVLDNGIPVPDNDTRPEINAASPFEIHVLGEKFFKVVAYHHPSLTLCSGPFSVSTYFMFDRTGMFTQ